MFLRSLKLSLSIVINCGYIIVINCGHIIVVNCWYIIVINCGYIIVINCGYIAISVKALMYPVRERGSERGKRGEPLVRAPHVYFAAIGGSS